MPKVTAKTFRVLVLEDNPLIRDLLALAIDRLKAEFTDPPVFELVEAGDGITAWNLIMVKPVDLAIVDIYVPILSGTQLIERIRNHPTTMTTKILAISASHVDARTRSLDAGADQFLQKPLRLIDVLDALRSLLRLPDKPTNVI